MNNTTQYIDNFFDNSFRIVSLFGYICSFIIIFIIVILCKKLYCTINKKKQYKSDSFTNNMSQYEHLKNISFNNIPFDNNIPQYYIPSTKKY